MSHLYHQPRAYLRQTGIPFSGLHTRAAAHVRAAAGQGATVLDIGCGPGSLALRIARSRPDLRVHGIDPSPDMVEFATAKAQRRGVADRVEFAAATADRLPVPPGCVDVVVSTLSFQHWTALPKVAAELKRVVRPGATILLYNVRSANFAGVWAPISRVAPKWTFERKFLWIRAFPSLVFGCAKITVPR